MGGDKATCAMGFPVWAAKLEKPNPSPIKRLKMGPAKHAVMAILASPLRAIVMLALKSPMEFPQARMVRPMMAPCGSKKYKKVRLVKDLFVMVKEVNSRIDNNII